VLFLTSLSQHLGPEQPFYALRAQGLDGNRPLTTVEEMAAHYLKEIQAFQPQGPYIVGGADAGGMVAWEMAQQLARASKPDNVAMVVLLDTPVSKPLSSGENRDLGFIFRRILYHFRKGDVTRVLRVNAGLQYRRFQSRYRSSKGVFFIIEEAVDDYVPSAYAGCVVLFMSEKRWGYPDDPLDRINPWRNLVSGRFNYYIITGEHLQIFDEPNVPLLAKTLKMHLDEVAWGKNVG
jgi:thioesterase domain-containing protein